MYREYFPQLRGAYLASHTLGPMPRTAQEALEAYARAWSERGVRAWAEGWWEAPREASRELSQLLGVDPQGISFHPHATAALASLLSSLRFQPPRNRILTTELEFSSILYQLQAWEAYGAEVVCLPADEGKFPWERFEASLDERVLLVVVSHAAYRTSERVDLQRIAELCHRVGTQLAVDAYQTAGVLPLEMRRFADYVFGGGVKWLLSGPGAGYLWVRESWWEEWPRLVGWAGHARPFAFEREWVPAPGGERYGVGTPNVAPLLVARAGYQLLLEVGLDTIWDHVRRLARTLIEGAQRLGVELVGPPQAEARSGTVILKLPYGYAAELNRREVVCDWRPGAGVRLGLHFFTLPSEIEMVLGAIEEIRQEGTWRQHEPGRVT